MGFAQTNDCDLVKLNRLSEIFQSTESTNTKLVYDDPNDPRFGTLIDTSRAMAATLIRDKYFDSCLRGEKKRKVKKIFGSSFQLRKKNEAGCGNCDFEMIYSYCTPQPCGLLYVRFVNRRATSMQVIAY